MNKVTAEEKYYAQMLHRYGVSINSIASDLGRTWTTVQRMVDPEKVRAAAKDYYRRNKGTVLAGLKRYQQTEKGKQAAHRYDTSDKGRESNRNYYQTDKGRLYVKRKKPLDACLKPTA